MRLAINNLRSRGTWNALSWINAWPSPHLTSTKVDTMKKTKLITSIPLASMLLCGTLFLIGAEDSNQRVADSTQQAGPYKGCLKIFDGKTFEGLEADPSTWSIVDGAMRGVGGTSRLAYTKADYGSFRLIFTARMNPVNGDHLGVLFWGDRPKDSSKPEIDNAGWIQFMPPFGGMWSYQPPQHHNLPHETLAPGSRDSDKWTTTEILCNLEKGTMRAAVDGVEIARYTHPDPAERTDPQKRIVAGPIGMFRHGGGASEYKDIYVEANPREDKLITVK